MTREPYFTPTTEIISVHFDTVLCVLTTSNDAYQDNGDYNWDEE